MRYGIVSDCHGNIQGLSRAWEILQNSGAQRLVCLGDIVGYGASSAQCIDFLEQHCSRTIAGNHDHALLKKHSTKRYQSYAVRSLELARTQLKKRHVQFLEKLPMISRWEEDNLLIQLTHAHPKDYLGWCYYPEDPSYSILPEDSEMTAVCLYGHTHQPKFCITSGNCEAVTPKYFHPYSLQDYRTHTLVINVGSSGQPRDGDTRVCGLLLDTEDKSFTFLRGEYAISNAQQEMLKNGLSGFVVDRLNFGR